MSRKIVQEEKSDLLLGGTQDRCTKSTSPEDSMHVRDRPLSACSFDRALPDGRTAVPDMTEIVGITAEKTLPKGD